MKFANKTMNTQSPFPPPHTISPTTEHTHTIVLLHGRGSTGEEFASDLFEAQTSAKLTLPEHFPSWKWVFPSSQERYSTVFQEDTNEWFGIYSLMDPSAREDLHVEGLKASIDYTHELVKAELTPVTPERIILGGISQGCATSLHALLSGKEKLGGYVGWSGWMPFRAQVEEAAGSREDSASQQAARLAEFYSYRLDIGSVTSSTGEVDTHKAFGTPVFFGHGDDDEVVDVELGRQLCEALMKMNMLVTKKEYGDCGHWVKEPEGFDDLVAFLQSIR